MQKLATIVALLTILWSAVGNAQSVCESITCDCESIQAGILNIHYLPSCRACQSRLREACSEVAPSVPIWTALTQGGYCETSCEIAGPAHYPPAPTEEEAAAIAEDEFHAARLTLECQLGALPVSVPENANLWYGCLTEEGRRTGTWTLVDRTGDVVALDQFD